MVRCERCGGEVKDITERLEVEDIYVGRIVLEKAPFLRCSACGQTLYPVQTARALDEQRAILLRDAINSYPERDFVTSGEVAAKLGVTRQALSKNRRIRRGFIYKVTKSDGCILYLRQSVEQYMKTGDGRFPLFPTEHTVEPRYLSDAVTWESAFSYREQQSVS